MRHEKDLMRENRKFREEQYEVRRNKDYEEALAREAEFHSKLKESYESQVEMQLTQHREILAEKAAAKHAKNTAICAEIVQQLISLSFKVCVRLN